MKPLLFRCSIMLLLASLSSFSIAGILDKSDIIALETAAAGISISGSKSPFDKELKQNLASYLDKNSLNGSTLTFFGETAQWSKLNQLDSDTSTHINAISFVISTQQYMKGTFTFKGLTNPSLFINGKSVSVSAGSAALSLTNGDHRFILLSDGIESWEATEFTFAPSDTDAIFKHQARLDGHRLNASLLFDSHTVSGLSMSPDGKHMLWTKRHYDEANGDRPTSITELLSSDKQQVIYRWEGLTPNSIAWSPDNSSIVYMAGSELFQLNRRSLALKRIATDLSGASSFTWLNANTLIFSWLQNKEPHDGKAKRYFGLEDRWSYWRNNTQIYKLDINSGFIAQITEGKASSQLADVDDNNGRILLTRALSTYAEPPHYSTELIELDLQKGTEYVVVSTKGGINAAQYVGENIYLLAGPNFYEGLGRADKGAKFANDYDGQLYVYKRQSKKFAALSLQFAPSISSITTLANGDLLVSAVEQDRSQLFTFNAKKTSFSKLYSSLDVVDSFAVSQQKRPDIIFSGSSATKPQKVLLKRGKKKPALLVDSAETHYANIQFSALQEWDYTSEEGDVIDGRVYLPPNFDKDKKYPAIVYYYGGTFPVTRAFTGRWPFSLWAAKGYVVYVMQPSGTVGYGQRFSAKHVNAWGLETAEDIIDSTQAFLAAHPFVDSKKVANMGASYGGFMTMYLATKTDLFAASVSHAGISNLAEYWGHGWWGYSYSGAATTGQYPWNATDFYTQQSPLFQADDVTTPLLLIHGDSDTNVPVSQSHQMYTALKILEKDVEFVEFIGEDHTINTREARLRWWDTIMAYMDYKLKDEPLWWETLYPEP